MKSRFFVRVAGQCNIYFLQKKKKKPTLTIHVSDNWIKNLLIEFFTLFPQIKYTLLQNTL